MKVIIRIKSPLLKRFLDRRPRVESLPAFSRDTRSRKRHLTPLALWTRSIVTVVACICVAMVAGLDPPSFSYIGHVGESLTQRVAKPAVAESPQPPEASFPYGSVPPLQSQKAPTARAALPRADQNLARQ